MPPPVTRARGKGAAAAPGGGTVLVTVGTTCFDALVRAVDDPAVAEALAARGYTKLIIQARRVACAHMSVHLPEICACR